jgi:hypothetical protein
MPLSGITRLTLILLVLMFSLFSQQRDPREFDRFDVPIVPEHEHKPVVDEFEQKFVKFYFLSDRFLRAYEGCPEQPVDFGPADCKAAKKIMDQKMFKELREQAKKLFDLEEKK